MANSQTETESAFGRGSALIPLNFPVHTIAELKEVADQRMTKMCRDYVNEGAMDLITLHDNEEAYNRYKIRPRVLINVEQVDHTGEIFGCKTSFPLGFAPAAMHKLAHDDGELATSRAAANYGICMAVSMYSTFSIEDVTAQGNGNPYVMHLGGLKDKGSALQLLERAEKTGCKAIFLSVDTPQLGRRLNEYRNKFSPPRGISCPNVKPQGGDEVREHDGPGDAPGTRDLDPSLDWEHTIPWIRENTKLQLWIKGICTAEDVEMAIRHGVDGILVSNHGGRQLDGVPATLDMLRECTAAARGRIPIAVDGGIRRGTDIFKALAMGAKHCFVGRIPIWGLAYDGQQGVEMALSILQNEFKLAMALAGCRKVSDIGRHHLAFLDNNGILAKL